MGVLRRSRLVDYGSIHSSFPVFLPVRPRSPSALVAVLALLILTQKRDPQDGSRTWRKSRANMSLFSSNFLLCNLIGSNGEVLLLYIS